MDCHLVMKTYCNPSQYSDCLYSSFFMFRPVSQCNSNSNSNNSNNQIFTAPYASYRGSESPI